MDPKSQKLADAAERQKALDEISAEDLAKIQAHKASTKGSLPVDNEWLLLAEFGITFGWQAYLDAKNDRRDENGNLYVNGAEMMTLIEASRRLRAGEMFENAQTSFIGAVSGQTKKAAQTFNNLTKGLIKRMKADE